MIRQECADVDRTRQIPTAVIDALRDAGVFRMLAPRALGGAESDPLQFLRVVEQVSYADGSAGWCTMIGGCYAAFGGMLPRKARARFSAIRAPSQPEISGRTKAWLYEVEGGYQVSGRWELASGSSHATWYIAGATVMRDGAPVMQPNGWPLMREFFFPAAQAKVIDTWESTGTSRHRESRLRGGWRCSCLDQRTLWFQEPASEHGTLYRMPPVAMFATFIGAVQLGIARHAIDAFVDLATAKMPTMTQIVLADRATAQAALGTAECAARVGAGVSRARATDAVEPGERRALADAGGSR